MIRLKRLPMSRFKRMTIITVCAGMLGGTIGMMRLAAQADNIIWAGIMAFVTVAGLSLAGASFGQYHGRRYAQTTAALSRALMSHAPTVEGQRLIVLLRCGHWIQTDRRRAPAWWCAEHGSQQPAMDEIDQRPAVLEMWHVVGA